MKIVIDVKNTTKTTGFAKNDVILYNGSEWYVTTKKELIGEIEDRCNKVIKQMDDKQNELTRKWEEFLTKYTEQNAKLIPVIEGILGKDE